MNSKQRSILDLIINTQKQIKASNDIPKSSLDAFLTERGYQGNLQNDLVIAYIMSQWHGAVYTIPPDIWENLNKEDSIIDIDLLKSIPDATFAYIIPGFASVQLVYTEIEGEEINYTVLDISGADGQALFWDGLASSWLFNKEDIAIACQCAAEAEQNAIKRAGLAVSGSPIEKLIIPAAKVANYLAKNPEKVKEFKTIFE